MKPGAETDLVWGAVKPKTLLPVLGLKPFLVTFLVISTSNLEENPQMHYSLYLGAHSWSALSILLTSYKLYRVRDPTHSISNLFNWVDSYKIELHVDPPPTLNLV